MIKSKVSFSFPLFKESVLIISTVLIYLYDSSTQSPDNHMKKPLQNEILNKPSSLSRNLLHLKCATTSHCNLQQKVGHSSCLDGKDTSLCAGSQLCFLLLEAHSDLSTYSFYGQDQEAICKDLLRKTLSLLVSNCVAAKEMFVKSTYRYFG